MRTMRALLIIFASSIVFLTPPSSYAQTRRPAVAMSPEVIVPVGTTKDLNLSLVNMGVPLRRVEITMRLYGDYDQKWGLSFDKANTEQYGLAYEAHYFKGASVNGTANAQDLTIIFNATEPQGYNQGSAQIPLATIRYKAAPGIFSTTIVPESTKITDNQGNLLPGVDSFGLRNFRSGPNPSSSPSSLDLSSYSLSFNTDPMQMWWPTAPNSVQQLDAGIWKDGDGSKVQNFTNLSAEWQVDSNFIEITDTSSAYSATCASVQMAGGRPCIHFAAHAKTKKSGTTYVSLKITDQLTGAEVMNSYPVMIYSVASPIPSPTGVTIGSPSPSPVPNPSFIPENRVSTREFEEVQQKVTYLQSQLDQQQSQLNETQNLLTRIYTFLKKLFRFN